MIVLNGGSSSGKSGIARCLQAVLPQPWLALGVDTLVSAVPAFGGGIEFASDGSVVVEPSFRLLQKAWMAGVAAMVRAGAPVIIDDVFLGERGRSATGRRRSRGSTCCGPACGARLRSPRAARSRGVTG